VSGDRRSGSGGSLPDLNEVPVLAPGSRFRNQPLTIEALIGSGASGRVYRVLHDQLGRFALKTSLMRNSGNTTEIRRELAGAKANYNLEHPNVVRVWDLNWEEDGLLWVRMELLSGQTVGEMLHHFGALPAFHAFDIALEVASGLQAIHEHRIIHRDVKPSNIMLTKEGGVKLFDFAYAKVSGSGVSTTQGGGSVLGSLPYMAPEHLAAAEPTVLFDVYALGVTLWEMLVGVHPLARYGGDLTSAFTHKLREPLPSLELAARLPAYVDAFIQRATAHDPAKRHRSIWAFLQDGEEVRRRLASDGDPHVRQIVSFVPSWTEEHPVRRRRSGRAEYSEVAPLPPRPVVEPPRQRVVLQATVLVPAEGAEHASSTAAAAALPAARDGVLPPPPTQPMAALPDSRDTARGVAPKSWVEAARANVASVSSASDATARTTDEPVASGSRPPPTTRKKLRAAVALFVAVIAVAVVGAISVSLFFTTNEPARPSSAPGTAWSATTPTSAGPRAAASAASTGTTHDAPPMTSASAAGSGTPRAGWPTRPGRPHQPRVPPAAVPPAPHR
jgi:serine/threonine protein kinase